MRRGRHQGIIIGSEDVAISGGGEEKRAFVSSALGMRIPSRENLGASDLLQEEVLIW